MDQAEALERLNSEKNYEDTLVENLSYYFIDSLEKIKDLDLEDRKIIEKNLKVIIKDSRRHSVIFDELILEVLDNEKYKE